MTTYMAYAKPSVSRGAIEVRAGAVVEQLVLTDGRVTGVQLHAGPNAEVEGVRRRNPPRTSAAGRGGHRGGRGGAVRRGAGQSQDSSCARASAPRSTCGR
ncbi:hypothetical protein QJS66_13260 [Kocuria rhizophila]|nr:hypothetical protein QJS66_13260 [Kocuria rhizophila]